MARRDMGVMRHALADRGDDLYETPPDVTRALLRTGALDQYRHPIWEPCAGRGAMVEVLQEAGHTVIAHDLRAYDGAIPGIVSGRDFLLEWNPPARLIVTNPPFKLANEMIRHGLALGCDMIVFLRLAAIEGAGRSDIIDRHLRRAWIGIERAPAMHREGWTGNKLIHAGAPHAWYHFAALPWPAGSPIQTTRISWRAS